MEKTEVAITRKDFVFKHPAGTSRGVMTHRTSWFIRITDAVDPDKSGIGECAPLPGLSPERLDEMDDLMEKLAAEIRRRGVQDVTVSQAYPSIRFGFETAVADMHSGGTHILFPSHFTSGIKGIPINGLIWMGNRTFMMRQIREKMDQDFGVIKIKIGALDFKQELDILRTIRREYRKEYPVIRLDANGAFTTADALEKLKRLAEFDIHSIEQPVAPGQWEVMASLCAASPIPVALDEELIGFTDETESKKMLDAIRPQFLILKPTLLGGFSACDRWINLARQIDSGWWVTSALESPLGLNAIAQWTATLEPMLPQGLGTGRIYRDVPETPLTLAGDRLFYDPSKPWPTSMV